MLSVTDPAADLRRCFYLLLTAAAVGIAGGKVVGVENVYEPSRYSPPKEGAYSKVPPDPARLWPPTRPDPTPFQSSNDRSRWATVKAIVEDGSYVIGTRTYPDPNRPNEYTESGSVSEPAFNTLDKVLEPITAEEKAIGQPVTKRYYSSKPPLFPTLLAGEYWLLHRTVHWSMDADRWLIVSTILLTVNVVPFAIYLLLLARLIERTEAADFGKLLAFTAACLGTFLTTFAGTLNNHTPGAFCVLFATYPLLRAMQQGRDMGPGGYLACGFFAGFATTFDLPAAALLAALGVPLLIAHPRRALLFFVPAALVPLAGLIACNYAAMGHWKPAYSEFGGPWYDYPGSHWAKRGTPAAKGIDFNNEPTHIYAFHLLFGHHGWFSLTPVLFVALAGLVCHAVRCPADMRRLFARPRDGSVWTWPLLAAAILVVSMVVFVFYLTRTMSYNYGGNTSGPRWLFWLIPLWLLAIPAGANRLARSGGGRLLAAVLLGLSTLSAFYPAWNPWRNPWLLQLLEYTGTLRY